MAAPLRAVTTEDRLLDLVGEQIKETRNMGDRVVEELRETRRDIRSVGERTERLAGEVAELRAIPRLVTMMSIGMFVAVVLVGIAAGAHVAIDAGWVQLGAKPAVEP